jgi:DNA helicase-2/ATP-dependent DNA helicase PcrA
MLEALRRFLESGGGRSGAKIKAFLSMIETLEQEIVGQPIDQMIGRVLERSGYRAALAKEGTPEAEARVDNLNELMASAGDFHTANEGEVDEDRSELELFLDQVALISDLDGWEDRSERVSMMTVHSSKGLEFPTVFLVGMEERIFPHASSSGDAAGLEEERRLCYVAMTRAMEQLFLTCAGQRLRFGERTFQSPSRFLTEVPEDLIEVLRSERTRGRGERRPSSRRSSGGGDSSFDYSYSQESPEGEDGVAAGMRVRHPVFGAGEVVAVIGTGLNQKLKIRFERAGVKTVMVRYANLELA